MISQLESVGKLSPKTGGANPNAIAGLYGEHLATDLLPRYAELARRGHLFTLTTATAGVTVAAANVSPLAAGTGQPILGVMNPVGSDTLIFVLKLWAQTRSGTPGGALIWDSIAAATITAAGQQPTSNRTLQAAGASGKYFVNAALTGGQAGTRFQVAHGAAAVAAAAFQGPIADEIAGGLVVFPGNFLGLAAQAAGTTWVVDASLLVAELPLGLVS